MNLYQNLLRHHPDLGDKLLQLFRDECALHARQGRRYSLEHFCEDLSDELWLACQQEGIPTTEKGRVSA